MNRSILVQFPVTIQSLMPYSPIVHLSHYCNGLASAYYSINPHHRPPPDYIWQDVSKQIPQSSQHITQVTRSDSVQQSGIEPATPPVDKELDRACPKTTGDSR